MTRSIALAGLVLLVVFAGGLAGPAGIVQADSIVVTSADDNALVNGQCTLREAIRNANDPGFFADCPDGGAADVITFAPDVLASGTIILAATLPDVVSEITIDGQGLLTIDADGEGRHFTVDGGDLTLIGLTLTGGSASGSFPDNVGGAIFNIGGALVLDDVTVTDNYSFARGAVHTEDGQTTVTDSRILDNDGSGISVNAEGADASLTITGTTIDLNQGSGISADATNGRETTLMVADTVATGSAASGVSVRAFDPASVAAAAIDGLEASGNQDGVSTLGSTGGAVTVDLIESDVSGNNLRGIQNRGASTMTVLETRVFENTGGGVLNEGTLALTSVTIFDHTVGFGPSAGIANLGGTVVIASSTLSENRATADDAAGGAIHNDGGTVSITDSSLTNNSAAINGGAIANLIGTLNVTGTAITGNAAGGLGGGIYAAGGIVTIDTSELMNNLADGGAALAVDGPALTQVTVTASSFGGNEANGNGGAIVMAMNSSLDVTLSEFFNNESSTGSGGAIFAESTTTIEESLFRGNEAAASGGALANHFTGNLTVTGSSLTGNTAGADGGAINNNGSTTTVEASTLAGNSAARGGALASTDGMLGATITLRNVTVSANEALSGAAIFGLSTDVVANNVTIAGSVGPAITLTSSSDAQLTNSIIADSSGDNCEVDGTSSVGGQPNLDDDSTCGGDPGEAHLLALGDNGGTTETHALRGGSDAIDAGDDATCEAVDQVGTARPVGGACDLGAFEAPPVSVFKTASTDVAAPGTEVTYTIEVTNNGPEVANPFLSDPIDMDSATVVSIEEPAGWLCDGSVDCTAATLPTGASLTFVITVELADDLDAGDELVNTATLTAGPEMVSDSATVLVGLTDLVIAKSGPEDVEAEGLIDWTIEVENVSDVVATGVILTDTLPEGVEIVAVTGAEGWTCNSLDNVRDTGEVRCVIAAFEGGETAEFVVSATAPDETATLENVARISTVAVEADLDDNEARATTTVDGGEAPPPQLFQAFAPLAAKAP